MNTLDIDWSASSHISTCRLRRAHAWLVRESIPPRNWAVELTAYTQSAIFYDAKSRKNPLDIFCYDTLAVPMRVDQDSTVSARQRE
ncbi:rna polymerase ii accessory cdc73 family [Moniliophthora roreri]|nr:rna polymerase ii accessory cdc73 family [Moniliophthora roreri]